MNILFAAAEMSPLAKVGGLGDVAGSLPRALRAVGADVRVAMPLYASVPRGGLERMGEYDVPWPGGAQQVVVWRADVRGVPIYLVAHDEFFGRPEVYGYADDKDRFLLFCDALLAAAPALGFVPDVVHAQDWHAAWLLARLAGDASHAWANAGRVYTIHNLALQGTFDRAFAQHYGIAGALLAPPAGLDAEAVMSGMALGIMHGHRINTVSDTYAREILTPEYGAGLDPLLRARKQYVSGIVNGIDVEEFDPRTDHALAAHFDADTIDVRAKNRRALQRHAGLPERDDGPLFGIVTRLWAQKGTDLVPPAFEALLSEREAQLVVLGTGDPDVHRALQQLEAAHPQRVKVWLEFNPALGQQVYAGCDVFLMPSRYEPCGLGQLIALRYGAVPLVRRTGGLSDTVEDASGDLAHGTGFVFEEATAGDLASALMRAADAFTDRVAWRAMQERGMRQDWSWGRAADKYLALYEAARGQQATK